MLLDVKLQKCENGHGLRSKAVANQSNILLMHKQPPPTLAKTHAHINSLHTHTIHVYLQKCTCKLIQTYVHTNTQHSYLILTKLHYTTMGEDSFTHMALEAHVRNKPLPHTKD